MLPHMEGLITDFVPPRFLQETYNGATQSLSKISQVKMLKLLCTLLSLLQTVSIRIVKETSSG